MRKRILYESLDDERKTFDDFSGPFIDIKGATQAMGVEHPAGRSH
jgi:hypothetical protein